MTSIVYVISTVLPHGRGPEEAQQPARRQRPAALRHLREDVQGTT